MTERIDHAAYARETIVQMGFPYENALLIAHAQVHATLALVEQQRIANLIAMFALSDQDASDFTATGFNYPQANAEIREVLGLT